MKFPSLRHKTRINICLYMSHLLISLPCLIWWWGIKFSIFIETFNIDHGMAYKGAHANGKDSKIISSLMGTNEFMQSLHSWENFCKV